MPEAEKEPHGKTKGMLAQAHAELGIVSVPHS